MTFNAIAFIAGAWAAVSVLFLGVLWASAKASKKRPIDVEDDEPERTKADRIRMALPHFTDLEIATLLDCDRDYVRAVRQRTDESGLPIKRRYDWTWERRKAAQARVDA